MITTSRTFFLLLVLLAVVSILTAPWLGQQAISWKTVFEPSGTSPEALIFWSIRLPRVFSAFLAGAALAIAGAAFQALFRNPLATPFTLGVSSAASLAAAIHIRLGLSFWLFGLPGICLTSFAGALLSIWAVYWLARIRGGFSTARLLLAGVAVSFLFSSVILFIQFTSDAYGAFRLLGRLMGSLSAVGQETVMALLVVSVLGIGFLTFLAWELDLLALGEDLAASRGVDLGRVRKQVFFATCAIEGTIAALCGPIGFVGLMVPQMARMMIGTRHRHLLPASFLLGGSFLLICDTAARVMAAPAEMPVGIITSLLGAPFFLWLLCRSDEHSLA